MKAYAEADIEASSGKGAGDENFPVASRLVSRALRPHFLAYYAFARATDDIADAPHLSPADKRFRLTAFRDVLEGRASGLRKAEALRRSFQETGVPVSRGSDLITAFLQDADQSRYRTLDDLIGYCRNSADPVGRFLLDLHGEDPAHYPASDALCTALQILNHLQDMGDDRRNLDRVYLPTDWLEEAGEAEAALDAPRLSPGLKLVRNRLLDVVDRLLAQTGPLTTRLKSRHLAAESGTIVTLARRLSHRLRNSDPLATRVSLSKADFALSLGRGLATSMLRRAA
jgi:squalene synthase HpnC